MSRQLPSFLQIKLSGTLSRLVRQTAPASIGLLLFPIAAHAQAGGTPFDTGFTLSKHSSPHGAKVASVVAIVIGAIRPSITTTSSPTSRPMRWKIQRVRDADGKPNLLNYELRHNTYIIPR